MRGAVDRWAPMVGVAFVVLVIVGGPVLEGSTPDAKASPASVITFYSDHRSAERAGVFVLGFAFAAYLYFAAVLRSRWRVLAGAEGLSAVLLAAAAIEVVGQCAGASAAFALTSSPAALGSQTAQALNLMGNSLLVISAVGNLVFFVTAGLMILRGPGVVPAWLGWAAVVIGPLFVIPPLDGIGFLALLLWVMTISVLLTRSASTSRAGPLAEDTQAST